MARWVPQDEHWNELDTACREFLKHEATQIDFEASLRYHRARVTINPPGSGGPSCIVPLDELDERITLARRALQIIRDAKITDADQDQALLQTLQNFRLDLMQLSLLLCGDLKQLRYTIAERNPVFLHRHIITAEPFIATFMQRGETRSAVDTSEPEVATHQAEASDDGRDDEDSHTSADSSDEEVEDNDDDDSYQPNFQSGTGKATRVRGERQIAYKRDLSKCVFTDDVLPQVAHIGAFTINNTADRLGNLRVMLTNNVLAMNQDLRNQLVDILAPWNGELGSSDRSWNMLSMSCTIHNYWDRAYFGLRWLDVVPNEHTESGRSPSKRIKTDKTSKYTRVRVEWHWLSEKLPNALEKHLTRPKGVKLDPRRVVELGSDEPASSVQQSLREFFHNPNLASTKGATAKDGNCRLIQSGRVFTIRVETEHLAKTKAVIDVQWLAVRMAALSGAGEISDKLDKSFRPPRLSLNPFVTTLEPVEGQGTAEVSREAPGTKG